MKFLAIVNSKSIKRLSNFNAKQLLDSLRNDLNADVFLTEYKGHACDIAKKHGDYDVIIAAGGDGTTFEIINSARHGGLRIALMPTGAGNSLAYDLGITSIRKTKEAIRAGRTKSVDLAEAVFEMKGKVHNRYFLATAGLGFFADIADTANRSFKDIGKLCYPAATLIHTFKNRKLRCRVTLNEKELAKEEFTDILINNTAHTAHMRIFREASIYDGRLNIWVSDINTAGQLLWNLGIITGSYFYRESDKYTAQRVSVKLQNPANLMLDGEVFESVSSAEFSISGKKISFFC